MFTSLASKVVTAFCALIGAIAFVGIFFLAVTGGSPYVQFGLALLFFAMFIVGSYWWMVFGPGRGLLGRYGLKESVGLLLARLFGYHRHGWTFSGKGHAPDPR